MNFTAEQIAEFLQGTLIGNKDVTVSDVSKIEEGQEGTLCFVGDQKYVRYLAQTKASIVLMSRSITYEGPTDATIILVDNARAAMAQLLDLVSEVLFPRKKGIEQPCFIPQGITIPEDAYIGAFSYIGQNVSLGKGVQIYPQTYIGDNVTIGDNTIIYAGVKIYAHCIVGNNCIVHSGVVIGADGFGFEPDAQGIYRKVPQIGNVIIEDDIEIGANTTIDRAMMGSTVIRRNAKLDNLVQIAHNVEVGESTVCCAQVGIAGSTKIGKHCILAGQTGVAGHIQIADQCIFGAQSGVANTVKQPGMYQGYPAIPAARFRRSAVVYKNLNELQNKVYELQKQLNDK
ncbi:MAG: UDP-3-O-(3-hydroxymyristoyl)glucosamine N-acyltransferase [Paludibacter sp.]|nr:UDP-3-O-(3-hydroxymyristoyl)glucosamine N-acyltransferase [Bacteroidales bacterium]MCM1068422.1 UDP-3-O-(3-hydroxymyristoyl)glucosamine N-acyltransferase [Prevotella sp.]MCM1353377.1 UDP-3-O-(3-hydroxymyristoyl)glucosamine N-acyltransferase [Bacteroides sp.]MCM1442538.1 UDP-3-O-(3-hydroxymyristoyl)glucosamine N-acyltransferase [Muribaculum sp.]MCM1481383.1 UDP-3-O-(3-hydroxymyristoyl)glucosamine N-acyltransferase [Paludibacter sp.]